jgi:gluconolactonase
MSHAELIISALMVVSILGTVGASADEKSIFAKGAKLERVSNEFTFSEGCSSDAHGNVYFTDQPNDRIMRWSADDGKITTFLQPCGRSNGTCFDSHGNLWTCAYEKNALWRIAMDGTHTIVIAGYKGKLLNGPNDVWIRPDGGMYLTDPFYQRDYWHRGPIEQPCQGVYFLPAGKTELTVVAADLTKPNGIIGTPNGKTLYVADIEGNKTYTYDIQKNGTLTNKRLFCELGSDGMTIDNEGNVYLTGHGVTIFNKAGKQIEHIDINEDWTGNICFGGKDMHTLFIAASKSVFTYKMRVKGVGSQ